MSHLDVATPIMHVILTKHAVYSCKGCALCVKTVLYTAIKCKSRFSMARVYYSSFFLSNKLHVALGSIFHFYDGNGRERVAR